MCEFVCCVCVVCVCVCVCVRAHSEELMSVWGGEEPSMRVCGGGGGGGGGLELAI